MATMRSQGCLSESATKDLLNLLVKRGYFHDNVEPELANVDKRRDDHTRSFSEMDAACQLVSTHDGMYLTKEQLKVRLRDELNAFGGRLSIQKVAIALHVDVTHVEHVVSETTTTGIIRVGQDLVTEQHMDELAESTNLKLCFHQGHMLVSELARSLWDIPMELTLSALEVRVERGLMMDAKVATLLGAKVLVTSSFEEREHVRIRGVFRAITLPTQVDSVCSDFCWDIGYVLSVLRDLCKKGEVLGEVHESAASVTGAMYLPNIYLSMQRTSVDEFFAANGFITADDCRAFGVLESKMGAYVQVSNPTALVLPNSVIMRDVIVSPVEQALIETIANDTFLDLSGHLPQSIMAHEHDVRMIVEYMALPIVVDKTSDGQGGCTVICNGEALFVSQGMIRHCSKSIVPPLIEAHAKTRAGQIMSGASSDPITEDEPILVSDKKSTKRKGKKTAGKTNATASQSKDSSECAVVPLVTVAKMVASEYPDLADIQTTFGPLFDAASKSAPVWEDSEDSEDADTNTSGGPLYEVCRSVLYNDEFQTACEQAVKAELERLESNKASRSVRSRKDSAAKIRSIESAFENPTCFNAACYSLQLNAKFLEYAIASPDLDEQVVSALKQDFLCGCCADFTSRITQYCLFRNEIEDGVFCIESKMADDAPVEAVESDLPAYCQPMDMAARRFPSTRLTCSGKGYEDEPRMPLPTFRVVLAGNVGIALARMWSLCGGDCYDCGSRLKDDGAEVMRVTRPGDVEGFLSHVEESCL
jgi:hypothetical protein